MWLGGNRVGAHAMEIGNISAVVEYAMLIMFYIMMAQFVALMVPRAIVCLQRCAEVIEKKPSIVDGTGTAPLAPGPNGEVVAVGEGGAFNASRPETAPVATFDHVSFRFPDADEDTVHDIDFSCRRGQTTAIIGSTGSGKSTIASNLRDGRAGATETEMRHALDVAQSDFVWGLPERLDAPVAQGGTNFSGGQRQRLAIARALMKHADLYIFDDSFSALDFKTDAALRRALKPETRNAAVLIIAQRINTILHADQIVVLKDGRIVGKGTHEELMEGCEVYREIAESQMKGGE